jgi:hypothetical protein
MDDSVSSHSFFKQLSSLFKLKNASKRRKLHLLWSYKYDKDQRSLPELEDVDLAIYDSYRTKEAFSMFEYSSVDSKEPYDIPLYSPVNSLSYEQLCELDEEIFGFEPCQLDSVDTVPSLDLFQFDRLIPLKVRDLGVPESETSRKNAIAKRSGYKDLTADIPKRILSTSSGRSFIAMAVPTMRTASLCDFNSAKGSTIKFDEMSEVVVYKETSQCEISPVLHARMQAFKQFGTFLLNQNKCNMMINNIEQQDSKSILKSKYNGNKALESQLAKQEDQLGIDEFMDSLDQIEQERQENHHVMKQMRQRQLECYNY